jgi:hypothetical protein
MKSTAPKAKSGGAGNASRINPHSTGILVFPGYGVNHALAQWRKEADRLWAEYQRTGNPVHLKAFDVHRAAMSARLATATEAKCR